MKQILPLFFLFACDSAYSDAKNANTVEAYEAFIKNNADHPKLDIAKMELGELLYNQAKESQKLEDYDKYINKYQADENFRNTKQYKGMIKERKAIAWDAIKDLTDVDAAKKYVEKYNHVKDENLQKAKRFIKLKEYNGLKMTPENPQGVKSQISTSAVEQSGRRDGWVWKTTITNTGNKDIAELDIRIDFLDDDGNVIDKGSQTEAAIGLNEFEGRGMNFATSTNPEIVRKRPPLKPGESRDFIYKTGNTPENWSQEVAVEFDRVVFTKE